MPLTSLLDEALEAWQYTRAGVIGEIKNLPDASLTFRPSAESRSAADIAVHIAESGLMMAGEPARRELSAEVVPRVHEGIRERRHAIDQQESFDRVAHEDAQGWREEDPAGGRPPHAAADHAVRRRARLAHRLDESRDCARGISS